MRYDRWDYTFITVAVLGAASSVVCSQFTKDGTGVQWWWLAGQITAVMGAALAPAIGTWRAKWSEVDARTQSRLELNSGLDPVVRKLSELSLASGKRAQEPIRAEIMALTIAAAHQVVGTTNATRSCFFEFVDGPPKQLRPTSNHQGGPAPVARSSPKAPPMETPRYTSSRTTRTGCAATSGRSLRRAGRLAIGITCP